MTDPRYQRRALCQCKRCGVMYWPKDTTRVTYCSRECYYAHCRETKPAREAAAREALVGKSPQVCPHCATGVGLAYVPRYCSSTCRWKAHKHRHPDALMRAAASNRRSYGRDLTPRTCKGCEQSFTPVSGEGRRVFCSTLCCKRHTKRMAQLRNPGNSTHRQRARHYGVAFTPGISWRSVMVRDGAACALCGLTVTPSGSRTDPLAATVDHRVPLSRGGAHTWDNVQLAHRKCNEMRGITSLDVWFTSSLSA